MIRLDPPSPEKTQALEIDAYPRIAYFCDDKKKWLDNGAGIPYRVGERWVNPLPDEASSTKWERPEKKDPLRGSFFSYRPSAGAAPRSVPTQQIRCSSNIAIADHFPSKTFSFKHHLTGEAWPACRAILPFHHTQNVCKLTQNVFPKHPR